jgi:NAD(P)-dependent dehydrogenase (short-subunit alcohol dehydrogenase family)
MARNERTDLERRSEGGRVDDLEGRRVVVIGGSRGLGLGMVEALVARGAQVTVVARDPARLAAVASRLGVATVAGDVADPSLARAVVREVRPAVLVLDAGATPVMGLIDELSWEDFERTWQTDVRAGFHWVKEAIGLPLPRGSRVIIGSSGRHRAGARGGRGLREASGHFSGDVFCRLRRTAHAPTATCASIWSRVRNARVGAPSAGT